MKEKIHPEFNEVKAVCACGATFLTFSTKKGDLKVESCSVCHPFYTGEKREIAQTGQVEKFRKRAAKASSLKPEKVKA